MRREQFKRCRKNSPNTRKGYVADGKVERGIKSLSGKVHYVGSLVQVNAFIVSKRPVKLGMADIDRNHVTSTAFKKAIGKTAGRTTDIKAIEIMHVNTKGI